MNSGFLFSNWYPKISKDPLATHLYLGAHHANQSSKSQALVDDVSRILRLEDAFSRDFSPSLLALLMGLSERQVTNLRMTEDVVDSLISSLHQGSALLAILVEGWVEGERKTIEKARAWFHDRFEWAKATGIELCPIRDDKGMVSLLDYGVREGVFVKHRKRDRSGITLTYERTGNPLCWDEPASPYSRAEKATEAALIADHIDTSTLYRREVLLTKAGLHYLLKNTLNPKTGFKAFWDAILPANRQAERRANKNGVTIEHNFGTLMTLCMAEEVLRQPLFTRNPKSAMQWAMTRYASELSEIWRVFAYLDVTGQRAFLKEWPALVSSLDAEIDHARSLGGATSKRVPFILCFGHGVF